jgi:hypothetical protein
MKRKLALTHMANFKSVYPSLAGNIFKNKLDNDR